MTDDASRNLFQQQEANRRRTIALVIGFVLFFAWLGFGGDLIFHLATAGAAPDAYHHSFPWFGLVLTAIGAGIARYGFATGPNKVLWSTGAREVTEPQTDKERQLVNVVEEMAIAAGVPRPRIWLVPDPDPNAFATGLDQQHSHIAVTQGLLDLCSRDELQAVVGHELGHVKNLDVRLMTTLAALVGAVALMHDGMGRLMRGGFRVGGGGGSRVGGGGGKKGGLGQLAIVLLVLWVITWILAPIISQFLAMAVSRKREYLADAMGAQFTRNPMALATALQKIENADAPTSSIKRGAAHLCIADPLGRRMNMREGGVANLLATHPPMAVRIARLKGMAFQRLKAEGQFPAA
ncbi:MAG TPA: M48 family metallopeptidase [Gemmatimonadales bacterium]